MSSCQVAGACRVDFVPASRRVDIVHDAKRGLVYVTTSAGSQTEPGTVLRWSLEQHAFLDPLPVTGSLLGVDLAPNQDLLAVADETYEQGRNWVHLVDLDSGTARRLELTTSSLEAGTHMPLFLDDETLLVTTSFAGSGWVPLRRITLRDGAATELRGVRQDTMIALSADRSTVAYTESNISSGPVGVYHPLDGMFAGGETSWFTYEVCISRDGRQTAVPTYGGTLVFDETFLNPRIVGTYADHYPVGCTYSPIDDRLYLSWTDWDGQSPSLEAYDSRSLSAVQILEREPRLHSGNGNRAFNSGRLKVSRDGALLFDTVPGGVAIYATACCATAGAP